MLHMIHVKADIPNIINKEKRYITLNIDTWFLPPANEVWGKVIFLRLSLILFTGGLPHCMLGYTPLGPEAGTPQEQIPPEADPPEQTPPLEPEVGTSPSQHTPQHSACWEIRATSGWYASYWNAILFLHADTS